MLQRLLLLATFALAAPLVQAQDFVEGRDFHPIAGGQPLLSDGKIEVVEVFGYPCIHCAHAAPVIADWRKTLANDVRLSYVPAVFGGVWEAYARAYYTAETMGVLERTHDKLFEVIHTEKRPIQNMEDVAAFYGEYGVDKDNFLATLTSFAVNAKIEQARQQVPAWGVEGTPSMVVAGKWRVMSPGGENGFEKMLQIVDFLVAQERAGKKKAA